MRLGSLKARATIALQPSPVSILCAGVLLSVLIGFVGGSKVGSFDWRLWATIGTAFGTSALAFVTWRLAHSASAQAVETARLVEQTGAQVTETRRLVELAQAEQLAAVTPCVYPFVNTDWLREGHKTGYQIPVRNAGKGAAINVEGQIYWERGHSKNTPLVGTTLAGGDHATVRAVQPIDEWDYAYGYLEYADLLGRRWQTRFHFLRPWRNAPLEVEVRSVGLDEKVNALGAYSAGWEPVPGMLLD